FQLPFLAKAGVENMTLSGGPGGNIWFTSAEYSWGKGIECTVYYYHCIHIDQSLRVQLERVYVHDGAWPEPGGGGYAIALCCDATEALIWDSISGFRSNKVITSNQSGAGSVVAYSYMDQAEICCDSTSPANGHDGWIENGLNNAHYAGSHHMLFEGNLTHQMGEDNTHGNAIYNTYFRNWSQGYRLPSWVNAYDGATINDLTGSPQGTPGPLKAAETQLYTYWESFVGN